MFPGVPPTGPAAVENEEGTPHPDAFGEFDMHAFGDKPKATPPPVGPTPAPAVATTTPRFYRPGTW